MAISFDQIPATIRTPLYYAEVDASRAGTFLPQYRTLMIAQRLSTGSMPAGSLTLVTSASQAADFGGVGSMAHRMMTAYRQNNPTDEVWMYLMDDAGAAAAASGSIAVTGAATQSGTLSIYIAGQRIRVGVTSGDNAATVATNIAAALTTDLPVTGAAATGTVTLTARHAGLAGNSIDVRINHGGTAAGEQTPAGLTIAVTGMSGGTANPDISAAWAAIGDEPFRYIVMPYTDSANLDSLRDELARRWGATVMRYSLGFSAAVDTIAGLDTLGSNRNDPYTTIMGIQGSLAPPWEIAAAYAGNAALSLTIDPARPLQTLVLRGIAVPSITDLNTLTESETLLHSGIATAYAQAGLMRITREVSTYQKDAFNNPDTAFLDLTTAATVAYLSESLGARATSKFPRHKLADDGTKFGAGQAILTPAIWRAEVIALALDWERKGLVEGVSDGRFGNLLIVERDVSDPNRLNTILPPDLVNGLRVLGVKVQFYLQYPETALAA